MITTYIQDLGTVEACQWTGNNVEEIKDGTDKLTKVFYEISEKLYKQTAETNSTTDANGETAEGEAKEGTVYDADYKVDEEGSEDDK